MKYMLIIYGNDEMWTRLQGEMDFQEVIRATDAHNAALVASEEMVGAYGVADQVQAKRVRVADGVPAVIHGPSAALAVLDTVADDARLVDHHRLHAARAFLLERAGEVDAARDAYREAMRRATSRVEQRHLERRLFGLR